MPVNDEKRRELKRKRLRHTRMELEIAREKGYGVNFTAYMEVSEYEPTLIEDELKQACVELNVLINRIENKSTEKEINEQVTIIHSLIRPRAALDLLMSKFGVHSVEQLKGLL